jgi:hypothetical protein
MASRLSVAALTTDESTYQDQPDFEYAFFNNAVSINNIGDGGDGAYASSNAHPSKRKRVDLGNDSALSDSIDSSEKTAPVTLTVRNTTPITDCDLPKCCVCTKGVPGCFGSPPTWADVCFLAMYALSEAHPGQTSFHIRKDVCSFIDAHFELMCQKQKTAAWRQTVNMTLSHPQYSDIFVQEVSIEKGRKGFYGLRKIYNPYEKTEPNKKRRKRRSPEKPKAISAEVKREGTTDMSTRELIRKLENELFKCYQQHHNRNVALDSDDDDDSDICLNIPHELSGNALATKLECDEDFIHDAGSNESSETDNSGMRTVRSYMESKERLLLEEYYNNLTQEQPTHFINSKLNMDVLVAKLGWDISKVQKWLEERRAKDAQLLHSTRQIGGVLETNGHQHLSTKSSEGNDDNARYIRPPSL